MNTLSRLGAVAAFGTLCLSGQAMAVTGGSTDSAIRGAAVRPYAPSMTCGQVAGLVSQRGAVVLSTGPHLYDRVVRDGGLCPLEQTTVPRFAATLDNPQCFVGYRCRDRQTEGEGRNR